MAHDVFISHSSKDKAIADAICANLEGAGVRCWIAPRDIAPGDDWPTAITQAISQSRVMVLVFSAHSNSSEDVSRELFLAANSKLVIIPFKIENIEPEPGKQYYLARTHWLDAINPPTQEQIHALIVCVKALLPVREPAPIETPHIVDQPISGNAPRQSPLSGPAPRKKATCVSYLWIPAAFVFLGLIGWVVLTFVTHTLPVPLLVQAMGSAVTLTPTPDFTAKLVLMGTDLYAGPGENYPKIGSVFDTVTIIGQAYGCSWYMVVSSTGNDVGWLSADQVTFTLPCSETPEIENP